MYKITNWECEPNESRGGSSCFLHFFFLNLHPPLISMLSNTICKCLITEVQCLCKVLESQQIWCLHDFCYSRQGQVRRLNYLEKIEKCHKSIMKISRRNLTFDCLHKENEGINLINGWLQLFIITVVIIWVILIFVMWAECSSL